MSRPTPAITPMHPCNQAISGTRHSKALRSKVRIDPNQPTPSPCHRVSEIDSWVLSSHEPQIGRYGLGPCTLARVAAAPACSGRCSGQSR